MSPLSMATSVPAPIREAHVGLSECRRVVDAIADHPDLEALRLQLDDFVGLAARQPSASTMSMPKVLRHALGGRVVVAGDHRHLDVAPVQFVDAAREVSRMASAIAKRPASRPSTPAKITVRPAPVRRSASASSPGKPRRRVRPSADGCQQHLYPPTTPVAPWPSMLGEVDGPPRRLRRTA